VFGDATDDDSCSGVCSTVEWGDSSPTTAIIPADDVDTVDVDMDGTVDTLDTDVDDDVTVDKKSICCACPARVVSRQRGENENTGGTGTNKNE